MIDTKLKKLEKVKQIPYTFMYCGIILIRYSKGPMFVDRQNVAGSQGRTFLGNWLFAIQCKTTYYFVKRSWRRKFVGSENPQNHRTLTPVEQ